MFVQVVTYSLEGITEEGYLDVANGLAPRYAGLPGLLAKIWLENAGANRYGAVYFWEDAESMERFGNSDLFEGDTNEFTEFVSEEFKVLERLTGQTQPVLEILSPRAVPSAGSTAGAAAKQAVGPSARTAKTAKRTPPPKKASPVATAAKTAKTAKTAKVAKTAKAPSKGAAKKAGVKGVGVKKAGRKATR